MAALNAIAREYADEIRDGIAWVIVWKTGRSWHAEAVWLNCDDDTFELEDLDMVREALDQDPNAVMVNGYYCGHFGEDMTVAELADGIRWHYENHCNLLKDSTAFRPEPMERPEWLSADIPWYGKATNAEPDPYVYDGYMSPEDYEHMHELMAADQRQEKESRAAPGGLYIDGQPFDGEIHELTLPELEVPDFKPPDPPSIELTIQIGPEQADAILEAFRPVIQKAAEAARNLLDAIVQTFKKAAMAAARAMNDFMDAMLYNANDHPKWWHLYKHAKKARTRKKYRRRLMQQLTAKLAAAT